MGWIVPGFFGLLAAGYASTYVIGARRKRRLLEAIEHHQLDGVDLQQALPAHPLSSEAAGQAVASLGFTKT